MASPATTGRDDAGVIHAVAGSMLIDGCTYSRATGVDMNVPFFYASGGSHIIRNVRAYGFTGGNKPVVRQATAGLINADDTVTVVTG